MHKLIILDYFLRDCRGHFERYDFAVATAAIRRGIEAEVWCPERTNPSQPGFVKQCLHSPPAKDGGLLRKVRVAVARAIELRAVLRKRNLDKDSLILIQEIDNHLLLSLVLATLAGAYKPQVVVVIRRSFRIKADKLGTVVPRLKHLVTSLSMKFLHKYKGVLFFSDSNLVTDVLKSAGFADAITLPIPHLPPRKKFKRESKKIIVGYFGAARYEKGFDLLPHSVQLLLEAFKDVSFVVQAYLDDDSRRIEAAQEGLVRISRLYPGRVRIIHDYLSNSEYVELIRSCLVLMIPYRRDFYGDGTSGILAEAIACGAWAVVPAGTWMAAQKKHYSRIITFDSYGVDVLTAAVEKCLKTAAQDNADTLDNQIEDWYEFHCADNYMNVIEEVSCAQKVQRRHEIEYVDY